MSEQKNTNQHPRPRFGKTRDDRLPVAQRTRGGRQDRKSNGEVK